MTPMNNGFKKSSGMTSSSTLTMLDHTRDAFLDGQLMLLQPKAGPRAAIDAMFLAASIPVIRGNSDRVLDAGSGSGIVSLSVAWRVADAKIVGVEIEPELVALAQESARLNHCPDRLRFIEGDITCLVRENNHSCLVPESFNHVAANPPYYVEGSARFSDNRLKRSAQIARPEDLSKWIDFLEGMVTRRGTLTLIHRAGALGEILNLLDGRFGGVTVYPLFPHSGEPARRVIVQGQKGSKAPIKILPGLVLHEPSGVYTEGADAVLRQGAPIQLNG